MNVCSLMSDSIEEALHTLNDVLGPLHEHVLIGGSCGLLLQGVRLDAIPRDLDCYFDTSHAVEIYDKLKRFAIDTPEYSETPIYRSELSHYRITGVTVEFVGDFQVSAEGSLYEVRVDDLLSDVCTTLPMEGGGTLRLTPLAHELIFNVLRQRPDRYLPIARRMRDNLPRHMPAWRTIMDNNRLSEHHLQRIERLLSGQEEEGLGRS